MSHIDSKFIVSQVIEVRKQHGYWGVPKHWYKVKVTWLLRTYSQYNCAPFVQRLWQSRLSHLTQTRVLWACFHNINPCNLTNKGVFALHLMISHFAIAAWFCVNALEEKPAQKTSRKNPSQKIRAWKLTQGFRDYRKTPGETTFVWIYWSNNVFVYIRRPFCRCFLASLYSVVSVRPSGRPAVRPSVAVN